MNRIEDSNLTKGGSSHLNCKHKQNEQALTQHSVCGYYRSDTSLLVSLQISNAVKEVSLESIIDLVDVLLNQLRIG